jgi:hypothetical protein
MGKLREDWDFHGIYWDLMGFNGILLDLMGPMILLI